MSRTARPAGYERLRELELPPVGAAVVAGDVVDPDEPLVILSSGPRVDVHPTYLRRHLRGATAELRARRSVAERLQRAAARLPEGFQLRVLDAWRSRELQAAIYRAMLEVAGADAAVYAFPIEAPDAGRGYPTDDPPHCTGGALDVSLIGPSGEPWPMGTAFDEPVPQTATAAYEGRATCPEQLGRRLLVHCLAACGFSNYPEEWWHFDYGNAFWRHFGGRPPGPVYRTIAAATS